MAAKPESLFSVTVSCQLIFLNQASWCAAICCYRHSLGCLVRQLYLVQMYVFLGFIPSSPLVQTFSAPSKIICFNQPLNSSIYIYLFTGVGQSWGRSLAVRGTCVQACQSGLRGWMDSMFATDFRTKTSKNPGQKIINHSATPP